MFEFLEVGIDLFFVILELCFDDDVRKARRSGQLRSRPVEKWVTR
jgi:hypothetical protein